MKEEWKPNMAELKVSIVFDKGNAQTKSSLYLQVMDFFNLILSAGCF